MRTKKFLLITIGIFFLALVTNFKVYAETDAALNYKKLYNITDKEMETYLEKTKKENPKTYDYYMQLKTNDSKLFEIIALAGLVQSRIPDMQSRISNFGSTFEDYKNMFHITDTEQQEFLNKLKREDPQLYQDLTALKTQNINAYNNALLGGISKARMGSVHTNYADTFTKITTINSNIEAERSKYLKAPDENRKQASLSQLKRLFGEQFDSSLLIIDDQIKNLKAQLDTMQKARQDAAAKKESYIEGELKKIAQPVIK
ncbi:MAG: hypothetical protein PHT41_01075 [Candidatus Omnitrophica bacterium]|nr:hypothetical protein [Candidatus Omnitrophota bacterium]MDD5237915.1 hypothetical protein [Candidatus Omnitrophota bacterium]